MHNVHRMQVLNCANYIIHNYLDMLFSDGVLVFFLYHLLDVAPEVLLDEEEVIK